MKIAIDLVQINRDGAGISYVMKGLIHGAIMHPEHEFILVTRDHDAVAKAVPELAENLPDHIHLVAIPPVPKWQGGGVRWYANLARNLRRMHVTALISPTLSPVSLFYDRNVQIVNDLSPLSPNFYFSKTEKAKFERLLDLVARKSWKVSCISQATKADFLKRYPKYKKEIQVIPLGLNSWVYTATMGVEVGEILQKYELKKPYFLSVSTIQPRKNYERMIKAFAGFSAANPEFNYAIVGGKGWNFEQVFALVQQQGLTEKVKFLGYVPEADLPGLYDGATALLYASLDEGFGLPVIEAAARGVPSVVSDIPVFRELEIGEARVEFVDPTSEEDLEAAITRIIGAEHRNSETLFRRYSWENCVKVLTNFIEK